MWTSHRLLEAVYFATVSLMLLRCVLPLVALHASELRQKP